jgi:hypothetical protein
MPVQRLRFRFSSVALQAMPSTVAIHALLLPLVLAVLIVALPCSSIESEQQRPATPAEMQAALTAVNPCTALQLS